MPSIDPQEVRSFYNLLPRIYDPDDRWHFLTRQWVRRFIEEQRGNVRITPDTRILNAGSGGEDCAFPDEIVYHLDIAENLLPKTSRSFVGDVHAPPFEDGYFDGCVCVGSVLNYCDAAVAIASIHRIIRERGFLFLEFETSWSLDYLFQSGFAKHAVLVTTFYNRKKVRVWAYSETYIRQLLSASGFVVQACSRAHLLSPLIYKITKDANKSAEFTKYDSLLRRIPIVRRFCSKNLLS